MPEKNNPDRSSSNPQSFQAKVWITVGIVALTVVTILILKAAFSIFLLVLAGILIAIFFRGLSGRIQRMTKWKEGVCLSISMIGTMLIIAGLFYLIGAKIQQQAVELIDTIPATIENVKEKLNESEIGKRVIEKISSKDSMEKAQGFAGKFFKSTFGMLGDVYVVLFVGLFFSISPKTYTNGIVELVPTKGQEKAREILDRLGEQLAGWLKGILFSMFVVFILTAIGLAILGMPLWLVLALLAGFISFIPNFGPLIALIPAVLVGMMEGPQMALMVAGLYILIQVVESNFITPLVQQKLIQLPPALIILSQVIMGVLTGGWGLILATPVMVIVMVLVQELYLKERNQK